MCFCSTLFDSTTDNDYCGVGKELERKAFHCTCTRDYKKSNLSAGDATTN